MPRNCNNPAQMNASPEEWVKKHIHLIPEKSTVADIACGKGRHTRLLLRRGFFVVAFDKDVSGLRDIPPTPNLRVVEVDLEADNECLKHPKEFSAIIVVNYLHRPLFDNLIHALKPGGILIYQTFMVGNERYGRPHNTDYLLKENELSTRLEAEFRIIEFDQGYIEYPKPAVIQKICATKF